MSVLTTISLLRKAITTWTYGDRLNLADSIGKANYCSFLAYNSATDSNQIGDTTATATVDFDTEVYDIGSNFATDTFTAPVTGKYIFCAVVDLVSIPAATDEIFLTLVTSNRTYYSSTLTNATSYPVTRAALTINAIADMDAADTAFIQATATGAGSNAIGFNGHATLLQTYFSGALL